MSNPLHNLVKLAFEEGQAAAVGDLLYHGSPLNLEQIDPHPSRVIDNEKAVFATPSRAVALSFLAPWNDDILRQGTVDGQLYLKENMPGAFDQLYKGKSGYLHGVSKDGFTFDPRLWKLEQISRRGVVPKSIEHIPDILEALQGSPDLKMIRHGEKWAPLDSEK